jgi:hypothetical protein
MPSSRRASVSLLFHISQLCFPYSRVWTANQDRATKDSPHDDNLGRVRVPVLMVACEGGAVAGSAEDILNRLGGADKQVLVLTGQHGGYGHGDPYFANDADVAFWQPMLDWILDR